MNSGSSFLSSSSSESLSPITSEVFYSLTGFFSFTFFFSATLLVFTSSLLSRAVDSLTEGSSVTVGASYPSILAKTKPCLINSVFFFLIILGRDSRNISVEKGGRSSDKTEVTMICCLPSSASFS